MPTERSISSLAASMKIRQKYGNIETGPSSSSTSCSSSLTSPSSSSAVSAAATMIDFYNEERKQHHQHHQQHGKCSIMNNINNEGHTAIDSASSATVGTNDKKMPSAADTPLLSSSHPKLLSRKLPLNNNNTQGSSGQFDPRKKARISPSSDNRQHYSSVVVHPPPPPASRNMSPSLPTQHNNNNSGSGNKSMKMTQSNSSSGMKRQPQQQKKQSYLTTGRPQHLSSSSLPTPTSLMHTSDPTSRPLPPHRTHPHHSPHHYSIPTDTSRVRPLISSSSSSTASSPPNIPPHNPPTPPLGLINIPLPGPFVNGLLSDEKSVIEAFEGDDAMHESTSKILYMLTHKSDDEHDHHDHSHHDDDKKSSSSSSSSPPDIIGNTVTVDLSAVESIAAEFLRDRKIAVKNSVHLAYLEMKKNHDYIISNVIDYYKSMSYKQHADILQQQQQRSGAAARGEDVEQIRRECDYAMERLRRERDEEVSELKMALEDLKNRQKGMLEEYVAASCNALRLLRKTSEVE